MEGVEIVITPRIIERVVYSTIIIVLLVLLVMKWDCGSCSTGNTVVEDTQVASATNTTNETEQIAPTSAALLTPCENNMKDAGETDIDCGGACGACVEFQGCNLNTDCETGLYCFQHIKCLRPSCEDGIKNQDETQIDCGGACKGFWWTSDNACHDKVEPSGVIDLTVDADVKKSPNSGSAIVQEVTLNLENGLGKTASATGQIFFRDVGGSVLFETPDGEEIVIHSFNVNLADGEKKKVVVDFTNHTRSTLSGVGSTEKFEIYVVLKDSVKKTILNEVTWTNGE